MTLSPFAEQDASPASPTAAELVLTLQYGSETRTVSVSESKCTIGASKMCTVHLPAAGVRPMHCVILRRENEVLIRGWSNPVQLNGRPFVDAALQVGDVLQIGAVQCTV